MTLAAVDDMLGDLAVPVSPAGLREAIAVRRTGSMPGSRWPSARSTPNTSATRTAGSTPSPGSATRPRSTTRPPDASPRWAGASTTSPPSATAALAGRLSGGQLAIITACVPERHFTASPSTKPVVVAELEHLGIDGTKVLMQSWLASADALDERSHRPPRTTTSVHHSTTLEGRGELRASVDADRNATVAAALRIAEPNDFDLTAPQRRAEALDTIFRFFLDHHDDPAAAAATARMSTSS